MLIAGLMNGRIDLKRSISSRVYGSREDNSRAAGRQFAKSKNIYRGSMVLFEFVKVANFLVWRTFYSSVGSATDFNNL
jgi:hypothetical protein